MRGETVTVIRHTTTGTDEYGNPVHGKTVEDVANVLVQPPSMSEPSDVDRPDGIRVDATLLFPRTYEGGSLRGCGILIRDEPTPYRVIGDPMPVDGGMTPTDWNMSVPVTRGEG
ncbi:hypothetical protein [Bifidobacterium pullorum]|uniref:hypothetical protein n=1 Tax=Bifidobacterium pullorum TaxID=78448 RepID=UPI003AF08608